MNFAWQIVTHRMELTHPWTLSRGTSGSKEYSWLRITSQGRTGWGEAAHNARYGESLESVQEGLKTALGRLPRTGFDPGKAASLVQAMTDLPRSAKAAVDMALLDLVGQLTGQSAGAVLGVPPGVPPVTSFSIGIDDPVAIRSKTQAAAGYSVLKIKLGTERDSAILEAVRSVSSQPLRVDANEGWKDPQEALDQIHRLASQGVELVEQPLPAGRLEDVAWLRQHSPLPIFADEDVMDGADIPRLAAAYDGINIKLMKAGGPREAWSMIQSARAHGLKIMLGCMIESSCGIAAAAHLSQAVDFVDLDGHLLLAADPFEGLRLEQGRVLIPSGQAGLGVRPRPEVDWKPGAASD